MLQQDARLLVLDAAEITERVVTSMVEYRARANAAAQHMNEMLFTSQNTLARSRALLAALASGRTARHEAGMR